MVTGLTRSRKCLRRKIYAIWGSLNYLNNRIYKVISFIRQKKNLFERLQKKEFPESFHDLQTPFEIYL